LGRYRPQETPEQALAALEPYKLKSFASTRNMSGAFDWEN